MTYIYLCGLVTANQGGVIFVDDYNNKKKNFVYKTRKCWFSSFNKINTKKTMWKVYKDDNKQINHFDYSSFVLKIQKCPVCYYCIAAENDDANTGVVSNTDIPVPEAVPAFGNDGPAQIPAPGNDEPVQAPFSCMLPQTEKSELKLYITKKS